MSDYYVSDKARITWDQSIESVVIHWTSFAKGDEFREPLNKMIELAVIKKAKKALFVNSHILVLAEDTKWFSDEWLPTLLNAGIQYTATVNPANSVLPQNVSHTDSRKGPKKLLHHESAGINTAAEWLSGITA